MGIANDEGSGCGFVIFVFDAEFDVFGGFAAEEDIDIITEADVLGALAYVEGEFGFPFAMISAVELEEAVFDLETAEGFVERRFVGDIDFEPAVGDLFFWRTVETTGVGTFNFEFGGDAGLVMDFEEKRSPTILEERWHGVASGDFDS